MRPYFKNRDNEKTQWVKALAAKSGNLSWIIRPHRKAKGEAHSVAL